MTPAQTALLAGIVAVAFLVEAAAGFGSMVVALTVGALVILWRLYKQALSDDRWRVFAIALVAAGANLTADRIATKATVTMVPVDGAPTITKIHLDLTAKVPGADDDSFQKAAADAKANCPISRLLKAAEITLTATLEA